MNNKLRNFIIALTGVLAFGVLSGCTEDDADVVSENISKDADNFKVLRRVVFYNGITDTYMLEVIGFCNIAEDGKQLEVTCLTGRDGDKKLYKKHFLGGSDNATYFVEQLEAVNVSDDFYKVTFKPTTIVPDVDVR